MPLAALHLGLRYWTSKALQWMQPSLQPYAQELFTLTQLALAGTCPPSFPFRVIFHLVMLHWELRYTTTNSHQKPELCFLLQEDPHYQSNYFCQGSTAVSILFLHETHLLKKSHTMLGSLPIYRLQIHMLMLPLTGKPESQLYVDCRLCASF